MLSGFEIFKFFVSDHLDTRTTDKLLLNHHLSLYTVKIVSSVAGDTSDCQPEANSIARSR